MATVYMIGQDGGISVGGGGLDVVASRAVWIDAVSPSDAELSKLDEIMGFEVPNRHDITEIELSSRLYREDGALVMIANLLPKDEQTPNPPRPAAFILRNGLLLTIRYSDFYSFERMTARIRYEKDNTSATIFCRLIEEAVADRADNLEYSMRSMEILTSQLFIHPTRGDDPQRHSPELDKALNQIGAMGESVANIRESITSLQRVVNYAATYIPQDWLGEERLVLISLKNDLTALSDEAAFFMNKLNFNLDAALGMINIEESKVIRFLSVVTLLLSPPTLIAGIYGMNFDIMPELHWQLGYAFALVLMAGTAIASILYLKRKRWM
ncbi:MAG: hypothetical protein LBJ46_09275 [Planctomycetota bacterium]|jgi:magnesium transporter|nr:hypothetical protein [Planctomycetota bacterium]